MYHIPNDKRAVSSADNLEKALYELLTTRDMNEISVTDLCHASGVSRATFYRLYDNPTDILRHGLDNTMETIRQEQSELMATGKPIDLKRNKRDGSMSRFGREQGDILSVVRHSYGHSASWIG